MEYQEGSWLKLTDISENYSNGITDISVSDKTITFNFVPCTDGDNNNYPVVAIGTQTWMAENLKTTKYIDGVTSVPNITTDINWSNLTTTGFCWYNNDETDYKNIYGAIYNW